MLILLNDIHLQCHIIMFLIFLINLAVLNIGQSIYCGEGVPILTRMVNSQGTYSINYECLCPIDYFGIQCKHHKRIYCYLSTQSFTPEYVDGSSYEETMKFNITFSADCYIQQSTNKFMSFVDYFVKKQVRNQQFQYELESAYSGIENEIIWANSTLIFDQYGLVKYVDGYNFTIDTYGRRRLSKEDEKIVLQGPGPYKFKYQSDFLSFPQTKGSFKVKSIIFKSLSNHVELPKQVLNFTNYNEYINILNQTARKREEAEEQFSQFSWDKLTAGKISIDQIYDGIGNIQESLDKINTVNTSPLILISISVNIKESTEFGMLKVQFRIEEDSGPTKQKISLNSAVARIPIRVQGVGEARIYNVNFFKAPSRWLYLIVAGVFGLLIYVVYAYYGKSKLQKMRAVQRSVEEQYERRQLE